MAPAKMLKLRPFIVSNLSRTLESNFRLWSVNGLYWHVQDIGYHYRDTITVRDTVREPNLGYTK